LLASAIAPAGAIADASKNFYNAASSLGYSVLALSYDSTDEIASMCGVASADAGCYFPTRESIIRGIPQKGAASAVAGISLDEGIADRIVLTLQYLERNAPGNNWASFLQPAAVGAPPSDRVAWSKIVVAGHSQGGGHAAAVAKLFNVHHVIQLAATCDETDGQPIPWTNGQTAGWASNPARFEGLAVATVFSGNVAVGGDTICARHKANWQNLGMLSYDDSAATCAGVNAHGAPVKCTENYPTWVSMLKAAE
jgi:hypothetical protein